MMVSLALHLAETKLRLTNIAYFPLLPSLHNAVTGVSTFIGRLNIFNAVFLRRLSVTSFSFPPSCYTFMFPQICLTKLTSWRHPNPVLQLVCQGMTTLDHVLSCSKRTGQEPVVSLHHLVL